MMEKQRIRYIFSGDVQEVGFRSAAFQTARQLGIAGWVKNVFDGTVEMEAQGTAAELDALLSELKRTMYLSDENIKSEEIPLTDENEFHIR
ncbi:MAG: acylphosphatase [Oscillospiraceae bacterium]|nr:acylphosphatase [Oscillospiraceae bacterium]